jgi:outer membrane protein assembly factor BamB
MILWILGAPTAPNAAESISPARSAWPMYRGNLQRIGRSDSAGPKTNRLRWVFSTGRQEKEGGIETDPVIGPEGTVYLGANNGVFYALDPDTGKIRWAFPTRFDTFGIYSSPFVDRQGVVYFGAKDGTVYALRAPRQGVMGEVVWSIPLGTTIQTSPAFTPDGTLVIGADDWAYYGITPPRGGRGPEVRWRFQTQGTLITSPAVDRDGIVYVASMDGKVYALEPPKEARQSVKVRWTFASGSRDEKGGFENAPMIDADGTLYIGGNDGNLYALDTKTGQPKWTFDAVARSGYRTYGIFSSVALGPDRTVYFGGKNGWLYAVRETKTFLRSAPQSAWRYKLGPGIQSSPLVAADGTVYLGDEQGTLHAIQPPASGDAGALVWKYATKGTLISSAALGADGTLYTASMDGKAYAFHDGKTSPPVDSASLSRTWYGQFRGGNKEEPMTAVLVQKDDDVAGIVRLKSGLRGPLDGKLQGKQGTFRVSLGESDCPIRLTATAAVSVEAVEGKFQGQDCRSQVLQGTFRLTP